MVAVNAYIFAGGNNEEWTGDRPKEIAEVDGVPVVLRTVRLLKDYGIEPVVVSHKDDVISLVWREAKYTSVKALSLCASVMMQKWGELNAIFLGDVYYSDDAMRKIFSIYNFAYGNDADLFAMRWTAKEHEAVANAFDDVIGYNIRGRGKGKLWEAFRSYSGFPKGEHKIGRHLTLIDDETADFDTVKKYEEWLKEYRSGRTLDETS